MTGLLGGQAWPGGCTSRDRPLGQQGADSSPVSGACGVLALSIALGVLSSLILRLGSLRGGPKAAWG